jgi:hypothetical protein
MTDGFVRAKRRDSNLESRLHAALPSSSMVYRKLFADEALFDLYTCGEAVAFIKTGPKADVTFWCHGGEGKEASIAKKFVAFLQELHPKYFYFSGLQTRWINFIEDACNMLGMRKSWQNPCWMYSLPAGIIHEEPPVPAGCTIRSLTPADAEKVNDLWAFKSEFSLPFVTRLIASHPSIGICKEEGELVSWIVIYDYSAIGMMFTVESHRRKGLGECCARALLARWPHGKLGLPFCYIVQGNTASEKLYAKLGFLNQGAVMWAGFEPVPS